jgi:hypothetical protein
MSPIEQMNKEESNMLIIPQETLDKLDDLSKLDLNELHEVASILSQHRNSLLDSKGEFEVGDTESLSRNVEWVDKKMKSVEAKIEELSQFPPQENKMEQPHV